MYKETSGHFTDDDLSFLSAHCRRDRQLVLGVVPVGSAKGLVVGGRLTNEKCGFFRLLEYLVTS